MEAPINKISRSLPGGGEAKNLTEYFAAWDALRGPLETELGLTVCRWIRFWPAWTMTVRGSLLCVWNCNEDKHLSEMVRV